MESKTDSPVLALKAHLALNVHNVEKSLQFYRKMLEIEPSKVRTGYAKFDLQNPPLNLTLNEVAFDGKGALSHLGIQVASTADVLAIRDKWVRSGLVTRDEMQTNCCFATQDKTWVRDPDGNEWEVFVVLQDNLPETAAGDCGVNTAEANHEVEAVATSASGCCTPEPVDITR
jgi:catechol 2,3-dioxygenase-like lactoylglutathione lyase family enzyme